jgi:hypothetical protein
MIILEVRAQDALEMTFVADDDMLEAFAAIDSSVFVISTVIPSSRLRRVAK